MGRGLAWRKLAATSASEASKNERPCCAGGRARSRTSSGRLARAGRVIRHGRRRSAAGEVSGLVACSTGFASRGSASGNIERVRVDNRIGCTKRREAFLPRSRVRSPPAPRRVAACRPSRDAVRIGGGRRECGGVTNPIIKQVGSAAQHEGSRFGGTSARAQRPTDDDLEVES
jgi:hypothetical protein